MRDFTDVDNRDVPWLPLNPFSSLLIDCVEIFLKFLVFLEAFGTEEAVCVEMTMLHL